MADSDVSTPVHKYLVCIDHSRWAESAFNFAGAAYAYDIVIRSRRVFREKTKKFLRWFGVKAKKLGVAKDVHLIIAHGSPGSLICEYIDERGIDSVYMGRRGLGAIDVERKNSENNRYLTLGAGDD